MPVETPRACNKHRQFMVALTSFACSWTNCMLKDHCMSILLYSLCTKLYLEAPERVDRLLIAFRFILGRNKKRKKEISEANAGRVSEKRRLQVTHILIFHFTTFLSEFFFLPLHLSWARFFFCLLIYEQNSLRLSLVKRRSLSFTTRQL
jgi:hypothetical protein